MKQIDINQFDSWNNLTNKNQGFDSHISKIKHFNAFWKFLGNLSSMVSSQKNSENFRKHKHVY